MAIKQTERNELILRLYRERNGSRYIQDKLVEAGYELITIARIWAIIRRSSDYVARNKAVRFCNFCLENKEAKTLYYGKKFGENKQVFRMCDECKEKLMPKQPEDA